MRDRVNIAARFPYFYNFSLQALGTGANTLVPSQRDIVTARVTQVNTRFAKVQILCVGDVVLTEPFRGQIRKEDVRATEKDRVEMYRSFRPGDIVLARVISLGDAGAGYLLTTAENELGVVIARSVNINLHSDWTRGTSW